MYKKSKDIKTQLQHLNSVYAVFEHQANLLNITDINKKDYINLLLKNYVASDDIITEQEVQKVQKVQKAQEVHRIKELKTKDINDW